ncbi:MAG: hypothetical protein P8Y12_01485 [Gammaproteobacteria bacterium]|jgi:hypothetical protein
MNNLLEKQDIHELAKLSCSVVNEVDFPSAENSGRYKEMFLSMLDELDSRYGTNEILFDARAAVVSRPLSKIELYLLTRKLVRLALERRPRLVTEVEGPVLEDVARRHHTDLHSAQAPVSKLQ